MRIDLHVHCLPISRCAHHQPEEVPVFFRKKGIDAICLTNHCYPHHCNQLSPNREEQARQYIEIFERCWESGDQIGVRVFFGVELKLIHEEHQPEFLLYGLSESSFLKSYPLYDLSQKDLFEFCNHENILMIQAHPFRYEQGYKPADVRYLHGIEVYNPHPLFPARSQEATKLADTYGLVKTAGSDFHIDFQAGSAGIMATEDIRNQYELRDYLRSKKQDLFGDIGFSDIDVDS